MDGKLNYCIFVLCKKPHEKRAIRREIANSVKVLKMAILAKQHRGDQWKFVKNGRFFRLTLEGQKNRKYKPYNSLISTDGKLNYCKFVLCKKPHEKRVIKREIGNSVKGLKMAFFFLQNSKEGPKKTFQKWPIF